MLGLVGLVVCVDVRVGDRPIVGIFDVGDVYLVGLGRWRHANTVAHVVSFCIGDIGGVGHALHGVGLHLI